MARVRPTSLLAMGFICCFWIQIRVQADGDSISKDTSCSSQNEVMLKIVDIFNKQQDQVLGLLDRLELKCQKHVEDLQEHVQTMEGAVKHLQKAFEEEKASKDKMLSAMQNKHDDMLKELKTNVHQCSHRFYTKTRNGVLTTCSGFSKRHTDTILRVAWTGNVRLYQLTSPPVCRRWYVTINGRECQNPAEIDFLEYSAHRVRENHHRSVYVEGLCRDIPRGPVTVALNTAPCAKFVDSTAGDTYLGDPRSTARFIVEEVTAQSTSGIK